MNLADLPSGHWVPCRLPDGRTAIGDAEDPGQVRVVAAIRRINKAVSGSGRDGGSRGRGHAGSPEDYAVVAAWLDGVEPLPDGQLFILPGEGAA